MKMKKNKRIGKLLIVSVLVIVVGAGCFLAGKSYENSRWSDEKERELLLNKSDLSLMDEVKGTIYVTGHKSPDSDTVGSAIAYANLLCNLGYEAKPVVLGQINNETKYVLKTAGIDTPMVLEHGEGCNIILVDHSEYTQSVEGLEKANILGIVDHHGDGAITTTGQLVYDARPLGATATVVWMRYRNYGVTPDKKTALVMMGAIISDTKNLQSGSTTFADREALAELKKLAGIQDVEAFYQKMYEESLSYEGMTDEQIFFSDYKEYENEGVRYSIGNINAYDEEDVKTMAKRMKAIFPSVLSSTGMDMAFAQINVFHDDVSYTCLIPSGDKAEEVVKEAFPDAEAKEGIGYRMEPCASRKKVVVPAIIKALKSI